MKNQALTLMYKVFLITILSSFSAVNAAVWNNPHDSFEIRWGEGNKKRSSKYVANVN